jgi:hypothetical protein
MSSSVLTTQDLEEYRDYCYKFGQTCEKNNIKYNKNEYSVSELLYIEFGKFCEHHKIDTDLDNYDRFLECGALDWNIIRNIHQFKKIN